MSRNTKLFMVLAMLYSVLFFIKHSNIAAPVIIRNYLADLLCMPFTLSLFVMLMRWLKRQLTFQLSAAMIVFSVTYIAFMFEYFLPKYYSGLTADSVDIGMYALGGMFYFLFQKLEMKKFRAAKANSVQ